MMYLLDDLVIVHKVIKEIVYEQNRDPQTNGEYKFSYCPRGITEKFLRRLGVDVWAIIKFEDFYGEIGDLDLIDGHINGYMFFPGGFCDKEHINISMFKGIPKEAISILLAKKRSFGCYKVIYDNLDYIYDCLVIKDIIE